MDKDKKEALVSLFNDLVRAGYNNNPQQATDAFVRATMADVTDADMHTLARLAQQPSEFKKTFGENAVSQDVQDMMRKIDAAAQKAGYPPRFKGFYPA